MERNRFEVHKHPRKNEVQYPAVLSNQGWSIEDIIYQWKKNNEQCFLAGTQRVIPSGIESAILLSRVANQSAGFGSSFSLIELTI